MLYLFALAAVVQPVEAQAAATDYTAYIEDAAHKTGLPVTLIRAVMRVESAGNVRAVSPKGAMGLMQIMPPTWQALRRQFSLGSDPFDPHDNILAGAHYLRTLYDMYGPEGFLAAYNAGPGRWENHRDTGQSLPAETRAYVVAVTQKLGSSVLNIAPEPVQPRRPSWTEAAIFLPTAQAADDVPTVFVGGPSPFVALYPEAPVASTEPDQ